MAAKEPRSKASNEHAQGALQGIRVLDMALFGPGPFCARILGDLGAEVIKIHDPKLESRGGPIKLQFPELPLFPGLRNCRFMGLNLKVKEGLRVFRKLVETADVVTESYRPGVVERLGVDYDTVRKLNRRIVYASITGFGQDGPYRDRVGHDINYISIGGLLGMTGKRGGTPAIPGTLIADFAAGGMTAAIGILAALTARGRTGEGQFVEVSMTDAVVALMAEWINEYLMGAPVPEKGETMFTGLWPWYNVYKTKDGKYISVGAVEPWFYANLCRLLGREDLVALQYAEGEQRERAFESFRRTFLTKTRDEWVDILRAEDTCVAPVYSIDELVSDPHLLARRTICEIPHPRLGRVKQVGPIVRLSASPFAARNWTKRLGEHTEEILLELGYSRGRIDRLRAVGVID